MDASTVSGVAHRIRLVPYLDSPLPFHAITRDLRSGDSPLGIGRFPDRNGLGDAPNTIAFNSKVVSRVHVEIWVQVGNGNCRQGGGIRFFIRDTKSSSGTFLNHVRLSPANTESRPHQVKDGDILQLGVDYQGGAESIYKSVKIRVELGREREASPHLMRADGEGKRKAAGRPGRWALTSSDSGYETSGGRNPLPDRVNTTCAQRMKRNDKVSPRLTACPLCGTSADLEEDVEVEVVEENEGDESLTSDVSEGEVEELLSASCIRVPNGEGNVNTGGASGGQTELIPLPLTALSKLPQQQRKDAATKQCLDTSETTLSEGSSVSA
ncbi:SMAD/FHA domain-containing protein [Mycena olivaceomarginata]|nr:SMAD/FHA domain-containing protein [Mycena olivaceomarginata]